VTHLEGSGPGDVCRDHGRGRGRSFNANSNDVALTINPGPYAITNPARVLLMPLIRTLENITIENGANPDNLNNNGNANDVGGGINLGYGEEPATEPGTVTNH